METSCDDTGIALVECEGGLKNPCFKVLADVVSSQIPIHRPFGGVVPMLAKREHIKNLPIVYKKVLQSADWRIKLEIDRVAVTVGPGLEPALWTGINFAKELAKKLKKPLLGVNHLEGHIFSNWLKPIREIKNSTKIMVFPAIVLVVSGGHTILLLMKSMKQWEILGETRDDAAGEAFDKVAKMLNLPYPGGPEVEKLSKKGNPNFIKFPRPMMYEKNYDFSFSGLKTAVLYYLRDNPKVARANVCSSFQEAVIDVLTHKTMKAVEEFGAKSVLLCGGVAANKALQKEFKFKILNLKNLKFFVPKLKYNTDNAVMIAAAAYINHLKKKNYKIKAQPNLSI